jgi:hypothetical protein
MNAKGRMNARAKVDVNQARPAAKVKTNARARAVAKHQGENKPIEYIYRPGMIHLPGPL